MVKLPQLLPQSYFWSAVEPPSGLYEPCEHPKSLLQCASHLTNAHDGLAASAIFPRQSGNCLALRQSCHHSLYCSLTKALGRSSVFPLDLALERPDWVRSINRSRSNSATAAMTPMVILPAGLIKSAPPKAKQIPSPEHPGIRTSLALSYQGCR